MKIRKILIFHLTEFLAKFLRTFRDRSSGRGCKLCSSRQMFQNEYYRRRYSLERFSKRLEIFFSIHSSLISPTVGRQPRESLGGGTNAFKFKTILFITLAA